MKSRFPFRFSLTTFATLSLVLLTVSAPCVAQSMTFCPHKIILIAQGQADTFQAVIRMPLEAGYALSDYDVTLLIGGNEIAKAISFRYCYIDDNFLAGFDREEVLDSPDVQALAGTISVATVQGVYEAVNAAGDIITRSFSASTAVEIVMPKKK